MFGIFSLKFAQIGGCINKTVICFVTFQLAETQWQLKEFFGAGRVVNTKYGFFLAGRMTLNKVYLNLEIGDNDVNSLPILFQDFILFGKNLCMEVKEWKRI